MAGIQSVREQLAIGNFSQLPSVQILSDASMNGAPIAYDKITNKISLSENSASVLWAGLSSLAKNLNNLPLNDQISLLQGSYSTGLATDVIKPYCKCWY